MEHFKVKALGTVSPHCTKESNCPGYLVEFGDNKVLLDAGNGITRQMNLKEDLKNLKVILTHTHWDHIGDIFNLGYDSYLYDEKLDLYLPCDDDKIHLFKNHNPVKWNLDYFDERTNIDIGDYNIDFLKTKHSKNSYAVKLVYDDNYIYKSIVYTSDIGINDIKNIIDFSKDADLLICESSLYSGHHIFNENHLHAYESGMIADCAKVKKLVLTHFWPEDDRHKYVEEAKINFSNTVAAKEGDKYFI